MAVQPETDPSPTGPIPVGPIPVGPSPPSKTRQLAAGLTLLIGLSSVTGGNAHVQGVMSTAQIRGYAYDFRYAGLVLVGIMVAYAGVLCLWAVRGLARAQRHAWDRALSGTLLLLLVNVPLIPVDGPGRDNAVTTAIPAAVNLILLLVARRRLEAG